ncbi:MAG TPA: plastocyanin/azurin family copper-binding protein [Rubricoccaceae bacterium]|nr:plastocyanin/azurin family copper-binding protein [Rubricoccaceae bacterium]
MRLLVCLAAALTLAPLAAAQPTTHTVLVGNFFFDPSDLTIMEGDSVRWENTAGIHNVHETTPPPTPPAGFGNPQHGGGAWVYTFGFETAGEYTYDCGVHGPTMSGTITVQGTSGSADEVPEGAAVSEAAPNPFRDVTRFSMTPSRTERVRVAVYDLGGREVAVLYDATVPAGTPVQVEWAPGDLPSGTYLVRIAGAGLRLSRRVTHVR